MRAARSFRLVFLLLALSGAIGCVTPPLPPMGADRTTAQLEPDEQALWKESRAIQYEIESAGLHFDDASVDAYLAQVLARATPARMRQAGLEPRIEVISNLAIDGYSFANGVIYIHTALLAQMTDETMLATMLTRELAHVVNRNALRARREKRRTADTMAWVGVGSSMVEGGGEAKLLLQAANMTSAVNFHHTIETIADERGLEFLDEAGYGVGETPKLYETTIEYIAEVHAQGAWGWVPFVPPPPVLARVQGMKTLIQTKYPDQRATRPPILDAAAFQRRLLPVTIRQAELELAAGLFRSAEKTARRATESSGDDPEPWVVLGRALMGQRTKPIANQPTPSIKQAREAFEEALRRDRRSAVAVRELAMSYYRTTGLARARTGEESDAALAGFRRYLQLSPEASDRAYIEQYIRELAQGER
ncbi:MAG: M48 family metalloprotease [Myxococcota bacterium]